MKDGYSPTVVKVKVILDGLKLMMIILKECWKISMSIKSILQWESDETSVAFV